MTARGEPAPVSDPPRLLVLYSDTPDATEPPPFESLTVPALERKLGSRIELYREYLGLRLFPEEEHQEPLARTLRARYSNRKIDVIVTIAFPALEFAERYADKILPNTPVVFTAVQRDGLQQLVLPRRFTGAVHADNWGAALGNILRIQPDVKQVVVVTGSSPANHAYLEQQKKQFQPYESRVRFRYLVDLPVLEVLATVTRLPPHSVVIEDGFSWDPYGFTLANEGIVKLVYQTADVPVYALVGQNLGQGFVGGPTAALSERYSAAAESIGRILKGERAENIPVRTVLPEHPMAFDARQLAKWHIPEDRLPPGSLVAFHDVSAWQKSKRIILIVSALCLIEMVLVATLLVQRMRRRRAEKELLQSRDRVRELAGKLVVAQEQERRRIARELHDDLSQQLAAAGIFASSILHEREALSHQLRTRIKDLQSRIKTAYVRIRDLSYELHPNAIEVLGLSAALRRHAEEFSRRTDIRVHFQESLDGVPVDSPQALCLYRVAQEALRNIEKHSCAKEAWLMLSWIDNTVELVLEDRGRGFSYPQKEGTPGLGLTSMQERVRLANGTFHISSAPGYGTRLCARVPATADVVGAVAAVHQIL